jgi:tripartite ATP-independent transporter DctP family solute receptor
MKWLSTIIIVSLFAMGSFSFAQSASDKIVIKLGSVATEKDIQYGVTKYFSDLVKEKTKGQVDIQLFFGGQLGNEADMMDSLRIGGIQMMQSFPGNWAPHAAQMGILDIPFQFKDFDHVRKVNGSKVGLNLATLLQQKTKVSVVKWWLHGFRHIYTQKPVNSAGDMAGVKIRVPGVPVYVETFKLLGAVPVSIPWTEVYTALQTGVVNACEAPLTGAIASKFDEVTKFAVKTGHIYTGSFLVINDNVYQKMTASHKQIIGDAAEDAEKWLYTRLASQVQEDEKTLANRGMKIINPDLRSFQDKLKPMVDNFAKTADVKDMLEEINRLR